jgi:anti-sigma regulatory factor (Ser/Thr protein kinase)
MTSAILWSHEAPFTPDALSASSARDFVCHHLVEHDLLYLVEDVRLVVSELVTNAVVHAQTPLVVTVQGLHFCVIVTVQDDSVSPPRTVVANATDTAGRGLDLVEQLSSHWGVSASVDGGKHVWALFATRPILMTPQPTDTSAKYHPAVA